MHYFLSLLPFIILLVKISATNTITMGSIEADPKI